MSGGKCNVTLLPASAQSASFCASDLTLQAIIQTTLGLTQPPQGCEPSTWLCLEANATSPCSRPARNPPASVRRSSSLVRDKQCSQVPSPCVFPSPGPYVPSRAGHP